MAKPPNKKAGKLTPMRKVSHYEIRDINTHETVSKSANQLAASRAMKRFGSKTHYSIPVYEDDLRAERDAKKAKRNAEREAKRAQEKAKKDAELAKKKADREAERDAKKANAAPKGFKPKTSMTDEGLKEYYAAQEKEHKERQKANNRKKLKNLKGKFTTNLEEIAQKVAVDGHKMSSDSRREYLNYLRKYMPKQEYQAFYDSLPEEFAATTHDGGRRTSSQERMERERTFQDTNDVVKGREHQSFAKDKQGTNSGTSSGSSGGTSSKQGYARTFNETSDKPHSNWRRYGRNTRHVLGGIAGGIKDITKHAAGNAWRNYKREFKHRLWHGGVSGGIGRLIDRRHSETHGSSYSTSSVGGTSTAKTMGKSSTTTRIHDRVNRMAAQLEDVVLSTRRMENMLNKLIYVMNNNGSFNGAGKQTDIDNEGDEGQNNGRRNWGGFFGGARRPGAASGRTLRNSVRFGRGIARYGGPALAGIGGAIAGYNEYGESGNAGRAASVGVGSALGGTGGALGGMKLGALMGSALGPVGTVAGGLGGMLIGGYLGSSAGEWAGRSGYDAVTNSGRATEQSIRENETRNRVLNSTDVSINSTSYAVTSRNDITFTTGAKLHFKANQIVFDGAISASNNISNAAPTPNTGNIGNVPQISLGPDGRPVISMPPSSSGPSSSSSGPSSSSGSPSAPQGTSPNVRRGNVFQGGATGGSGGVPQSAAQSNGPPIISGLRNDSTGLFGAIPNSQSTREQGTGARSGGNQIEQMPHEGQWNRGTRFNRRENLDRANWMMNYLMKEHGLSAAQASGIVGNVNQESRMRSTAENNNGERSFGLFQWNGSRQDQLRRWSQLNGRDVNDPRTQLDYAMHEAKQRRDRRGVSDYDHLRRQETPQDASRSWMQRFERPRDNATGGENDRARGNAANRYHSDYNSRGGTTTDGQVVRPQSGPLPEANQMRSTPGFSPNSPFANNPNLAGIPISPDARNQTPGNGTNGWHMPSSGTVNSQYGMRTHPLSGVRRMHGGTDIRPPTRGQLVDVHSMRDGRIQSINRHGDVTIKHDNGYTTIYRHINPQGLAVGQPVKGGERLGSLRRHDSRSTGPHLHVEALDPRGNRINPSQLIPDLGTNGSRMEGGISRDSTPVTPITSPSSEQNAIKYQAEILRPDAGNRPFQGSPETTSIAGTVNGRSRPFQGLPEDGAQPLSTEVGRNNLAQTGAAYIAQRQQAQILRSDAGNRPFQGLPEDGAQPLSTEVGRNNLAQTGAAYIAQRQQAQIMQRAIEDGKEANKTAIEQSFVTSDSARRAITHPLDQQRSTAPSHNPPTNFTAPSESATPTGRFAEEVNRRGAGAIVEPIERDNMSLHKFAEKVSQ